MTGWCELMGVGLLQSGSVCWTISSTVRFEHVNISCADGLWYINSPWRNSRQMLHHERCSTVHCTNSLKQRTAVAHNVVVVHSIICSYQMSHLDVKLSRVMMPRNLRKRLGEGLRPHSGYTMAPNSRGKTAPMGSSASSLADR